MTSVIFLMWLAEQSKKKQHVHCIGLTAQLDPCHPSRHAYTDRPVRYTKDV